MGARGAASSAAALDPQFVGAPPPGEPCAGLVETHTSIVLLLGDRAFKVKKPVRLPFVDLSTRERRLANCRDEVTLNRRFSPDVYLGLLEVRAPASEGPSAEPGEPVVVMRRMPAERRLSTLLLAGRHDVVAGAVDDVARRVAAAHARQPAVRGFGLAGTMTDLWREGHEQLAPFADLLAGRDAATAGSGADPSALDDVAALAVEYLAGRAGLLDRREAAGLVRDGHGDLLADDIFVLDDGARILDCLEFDSRLRLGDVLADVAFLAMDLESLGASDLARRLVAAYRHYSAETHPRSLEHHYVAYRAFVRAKVSCLRHGQGDADAAARAVELLALARNHLLRGRLHLVLVGGLPGTGKSTLAAGLVDADPDREWALVSSDRVRKEAAGLRAEDSARVPFGQGLYRPERTSATYAELARRAATALDSGVNVVLDASWTDARQRARLRDVADRHHCVLTEVRCAAPDAVCRSRLADRADARRAGLATPSDAGPAVHEAMARLADPWPQARTVPTTGPPGLAVAEVLAALAARRPEPEEALPCGW